MESLERYCGRKAMDTDFLTLASFKELGTDKAINPAELFQFSKYQLDYGWINQIKSFDPQDIIPWVEIQENLTRKIKKVPLSFVSYAQKISNCCYPCHFLSSSSGMAAHTVFDEAVKRGALEIIERDAILIHWFNKIKPKRIILGHTLDYTETLSTNLEKLGYELILADLTLDTMPVVIAMAVKKDGEFPFFAGAASYERKIDAIKKAEEELEFTVWQRMKHRNKLRQKIKDTSLKEIREPTDHEALYLKPEMFKHLKFLFEGPVHRVSENELYDKTDLYSVLGAGGFKLYHLDMTAREVRQLELGIKVVRAIIPGFVPITFGYGQEPLGMRRIYETPVKIGLRNKKITETEIINNYLPHFFP